MKMNILLFILSIFNMTLLSGATSIYANNKSDSSAQPKQLYQADPTIFVEDNKYYLYGTNEEDASKGFKVFVSDDMIHWLSPDVETDRFALKKEDSFGDNGFWAPQVFLHKGTYYMAYTANEQIAIAKSDSPLGPFIQDEKKPLSLGTTNKAIDPFVYIDGDGQIYLYYVELNNGNNICVEKLKDDLSGTVIGTKRECIRAIAGWENTENAPWPVSEGPTVINRDGIYYLFYSANDFRNPDYAVGYATSKSPLGPWKKHNGPIISKNNLKINGTGHGDIFIGNNGEMYYVLHTHFSNNKPTPRKTAIVKLSYTSQGENVGIFTADSDSFYFLMQQEKVEEQIKEHESSDKKTGIPKKFLPIIILLTVIIGSATAIILKKIKYKL